MQDIKQAPWEAQSKNNQPTTQPNKQTTPRELLIQTEVKCSCRSPVDWWEPSPSLALSLSAPRRSVRLFLLK